jgi:hypothetical protein
MIFRDYDHQAFYEDCLRRERAASDVYRKALFYTLGLTAETRDHLGDVYSFTEHGINPNGLNAAWQTGSSVRVTQLAFNLFNGFAEEPPNSSSSQKLFCDSFLPYMLEAVKLRYPEYARSTETEANNGQPD